jgi:hypothetical protein
MGHPKMLETLAPSAQLKHPGSWPIHRKLVLVWTNLTYTAELKFHVLHCVAIVIHIIINPTLEFMVTYV